MIKKILDEAVAASPIRRAAMKSAIAQHDQNTRMGEHNLDMAKANVRTQNAMAKKIYRQSKIYNKDQKIMKEAENLDLTIAAVEKDPVGFESTFNNIMTDIVSAAVDNWKNDIASNLYSHKSKGN